jgi:hypothetical protein
MCGISYSKLMIISRTKLTNRILRIPTGSCQKLLESLVSDSDRKLSESVGMTRFRQEQRLFRHFPTSDNFLSESDTEDSNNFRRIHIGSDSFSDMIRRDPTVGSVDLVTRIIIRKYLHLKLIDCIEFCRAHVIIGKELLP